MDIFKLIGYENIEKTANRKMSHMNYSNIISLISLYKEIKFIDSKNQLYKYLCNFTPYPKKKEKKENKNYLIENQNYSSLTDTMKFYKKINQRTHNCIQKIEKPLNFTSKKNKNLQRYNNIMKRLQFIEQEKLAIRIQKHIKSYLKRIALIKTINKIIIEKFIRNIIKIQNTFKNIYFKREFKINYFINLICEKRKNNIAKIQEILISYYNKVNKKKEMIIKGILDNRLKNIILIQSNYRAIKIRKKFKKLIQYRKYNYILTFPYYAKNVEIRILQNQNKIKFFQTYNFEKCPIQNIFKLYINYSELNPGNYYCQFLVDNKLFIDPRFPYFENKDGQTFNQIEFSKGKIIEGEKEYDFQRNKINILETKKNNMENLRKNIEINKNNYNDNNKINNSTYIKQNIPINNNKSNKSYETYNIDYNSYTFNTLKPDLGNQKNSNYENYYNSGNKNIVPFTNYTSDNSNNNSRKQSNEDDYYTSLKKNLEGIVFEYVD